MLDFLKQVNISDIIIDLMDSRFDESLKYNLNVNSENCIGIILYMQKVGINNVDDLLLDKPEWFLKTTSDFIRICSNNKDLINQINEDYNNVVI